MVVHCFNIMTQISRQDSSSFVSRFLSVEDGFPQSISMPCQNWEFGQFLTPLISETEPFLFGPLMCSDNVISNIKCIKTEKPEMNTCKAE